MSHRRPSCVPCPREKGGKDGGKRKEGDLHTGVLELVVDALCEGGRQMEPSSAKIISYILGILDIIRARISDQTTIL